MKTGFSVLALFISLVSSSQQSATNTPCIPKPDTLDGRKVFRLANQLAEFKGGERMMMEYIEDRLQKKGKKRNLTVSLTITFVVDSAGQVRNPCIMKISSGNDMGLVTVEQEILNLFVTMPKWNPAVLQGKKTCTRVIMPVQLMIQ
jgi:hypothetical protein